MPSRAERRRLERERADLERQVGAIVREARKIGKPHPTPPQLVSRVFGGWEWCVSCGTHAPNAVEHWHISAMLYPKGRGSREHDWEILGYVMHLLYSKSTGVTGDAPLPITPFETTHPNRPHHWVWHNDRSPVDYCGVEVGKAFLDDMYREPTDEKRKRKLAQYFYSKVWQKAAKA